MSHTGRTRIFCTALATLSLAACQGVEDIPALVPHVEPSDPRVDRSPLFRSQTELELCDRRVPPPRC